MDSLQLPQDQPISTPEELNQRLRQIIDCQHDRYTGMDTFTVALMAQPLKHHLRADCKLHILMQEDHSWSALLTLAFKVKGEMSFPPPGEPVHWLVNEQRVTSCIIDSNGQTITRDFHIGGDAMPGPMMLWVSAPVTVARTSGWISIWLPDHLMQAMYEADFAEFRVAGMEFRLGGYSHGNAGKPNPLRHYVTGLRGFAERRPNDPEVAPLLEIVAKKKAEESFGMKVGVALLVACGFFSLISKTKDNLTQNTYVPVANTYSPPAVPSEPKTGDPEIQARVLRGKHLFETVKAQTPVSRNPEVSGQLTACPILTLYVTNVAWNKLSKEQQVDLTWYLESLIPSAKAQPEVYTGIPQIAPFYPKALEIARNLCGDCWSILLGNAVNKGGERTMTLDRNVVQGDTPWRSKSDYDQSVRASEFRK